MRRRKALEALAERRWDLLVIGGGITGLGVAVEAARRGLSAAVIEACDFAAGTSSRSTKLIHGGFRYLKEREFRLVRESVAERMALMRQYPHLVRPAWFLFPVYRGDPDPLWLLRLGLWLYDRFAGPALGPYRHRRLSAEEALREEPWLAPAELLGAAMYVDAVTDDARLVMAVLREAAAAGVVAVNYSAAVGFLREASGRIVGVVARDRAAEAGAPASGGSGEAGAEASDAGKKAGPAAAGRRERGGGPSNGAADRSDGAPRIEIWARTVLNAAGPWADAVRRLDDPAAAPLLFLTKGVHVVVPRRRLPLRQAVVLRGPDRRLMFAVPRDDFVYAGTTDTPYAGDLVRPRAEAEEVTYILRALRQTFPEAGVGPDDVVATWAGIRPLVAPSGSVADPSAVSRDYQLFAAPSGLVTVGGGKLTAFRAMARHIVDALFPTTRRKKALSGGEAPDFAVEGGAPGAAFARRAALAIGEGRAASGGGGPGGAGERVPAAGAFGPEDRIEAFAPDGREPADETEGWAAWRARLLFCFSPEEAEAILEDAAREAAAEAGGAVGAAFSFRARVLRAVARAAVREQARTLEDVLFRRYPEALFSPDNGLGVAEAVNDALAEALGLTPEAARRSMDGFRAAVRAMHAWRKEGGEGPG
ncbi:FAD-dependent oxidoreductase [Hydrogenibacillus sp. N12]|uniref:glycerol-3-phosphate dehydrogenase/oxidase n=1 Tax=Hydrogenibacillus sp. N12 TaxID=2866627 RepID=UPI001C7E008C|nr:FAD-dependent oxidoreductase [Hydrogenibacillus sp. N12]QZA33681.1 FAD-dependent oxidoreductase [Hydrogenibacillus sp. N12]